jgi:hypothetical protein
VKCYSISNIGSLAAADFFNLYYNVFIPPPLVYQQRRSVSFAGVISGPSGRLTSALTESGLNHQDQVASQIYHLPKNKMSLTSATEKGIIGSYGHQEELYNGQASCQVTRHCRGHIEKLYPPRDNPPLPNQPRAADPLGQKRHSENQRPPSLKVRYILPVSDQLPAPV